MTQFSLRKTALGLALALLTASPLLAHGATVDALLGPGINLLSDNNAESLINADGSPAGPADSTLDVGDSVRGIFSINTIEPIGAGLPEVVIGGGTGNNELTGIFQFTVASKFAPADIGNPSPGDFFFTFAADPAFATELDTYANVPFSALELAGTMIAVFEDPANNYFRTGASQAANETSAIGGTFRAALGLSAPGDFFQTAANTDDILVVQSIPAPGNGGTTNLGLTFLLETFAHDFAAVNCLDPTSGLTLVGICGSTSLLGTGGAVTAWDVFTDTNFTINVAQVPEPGTLALLGAIVFGAGWLRQRRIA
jgi:hypothetical protein